MLYSKHQPTWFWYHDLEKGRSGEVNSVMTKLKKGTWEKLIKPIRKKVKLLQKF